MMNIQLDDRLKNYMQENQLQNILITSMMCHTWGGSRLEISARFVDKNETERLKADNFKSFPHELGEVLIRRIPEKADDTVHLGLSRFFKKIIVEGLYSA